MWERLWGMSSCFFDNWICLSDFSLIFIRETSLIREWKLFRCCVVFLCWKQSLNTCRKFHENLLFIVTKDFWEFCQRIDAMVESFKNSNRHYRMQSSVSILRRLFFVTYSSPLIYRVTMVIATNCYNMLFTELLHQETSCKMYNDAWPFLEKASST